MKPSRIAEIAAIALLISGCGKVGAPLPPIIRTPVAVTDLAANQNGYDIVLTWTNPPRYIDGNTATDLSNVRILRNGEEFAVADVTAAGQAQAYVVDARNSLGTQQSFSIRVESQKGVASASNSVVIATVDVPGPVERLAANPDQFRIRVYWQLPSRNANLAQSFLVRRNDRMPPPPVTDLFFDDTEVEPGKTYTYTVMAVPAEEGGVPGPAASVVIVNEDKTSPQAPPGLAVESDPAGAGVYLSWSDNTEADLFGYRIYRSDRSDGVFVLQNPAPWRANVYFDKDYRPGLFYKISAVDSTGNESPQSPAQRGP